MGRMGSLIVPVTSQKSLHEDANLPADQLFCILHPRARVFPELWKVIWQRSLKLYGPIPELSFNVRHPQSGLKSWQLPIVRWSRQCLQTPALQPGCNEQERMQTQLQGCMTHTQRRWVDGYGLGGAWLDIVYSLRITLQQVGDKLWYIAGNVGGVHRWSGRW